MRITNERAATPVPTGAALGATPAATSRTPERLALSKIQVADIQVRVKLDPKVVAEYAEQIQENDSFPPIDVFFDGKDYHVADGLHRLAATRKEQCKDILAVVHEGSRQDAVWFALGANKAHGLRLSSADKRKAVEVALREFTERCNRDIARQIGCGDQLVGDVRAELESNCVIPAVEKTVGADGKLRPAKRKVKPAPVSEPAAASDNVADATPDTPMADGTADPDEHDARAATEQPVVQEAKPVGLAMAQSALDILKAIPTDDAERMQAISLISAWLVEVITALRSDGRDQPEGIVGRANEVGVL